MEMTIKKDWFYENYKATGKKRTAIFSERKALMEELYATGVPIYCDKSYYHIATSFDLVTKEGGHFCCDVYKRFENWRDCHYYYEYEDINGNKVWLMEGGRYD